MNEREAKIKALELAIFNLGHSKTPCKTQSKEDARLIGDEYAEIIRQLECTKRLWLHSNNASQGIASKH
jgi:hypothetical protein